MKELRLESHTILNKAKKRRAMEGEQEVEEEVSDQGTTPRERAENG